ncbi:MFS transporter [Agaricicola taiwanensis]|uniref:MFS transporter n=1 Tax=Agaricicola taiwanensis TaxID=591372 RepID=A0A8J2VK91_9RHOB|nr:transcription antitermination factor NusB [Agaricicola taiwanensis]GGE27718.1 MFS transporter [Agaricicola taiwanensis]
MTRSRVWHRAPKPEAPSQGLAARRAATILVDGVLRRKQPLDEQLEAEGGPLVALDARDRSLARAIAGISLRRIGSLRAILDQLLAKGLPGGGSGPLEAMLITGAAQILFLDVPDHAAVSLAVDQAQAHRATKPFAPLVNAMLRNVARQKDEFVPILSDPSRDVPRWLQTRRVKAYGADIAQAVAAAERSEAALDISVKGDPGHWAQVLGGIVMPTGTVRVADAGVVPELPGFAEGDWWVQDAAAALPAALFTDIAGKRIADLCAAPGGKTAQLAAHGASVTALDRSRRRLQRLEENMTRLGFSVEAVAADAGDWNGGQFEGVLLDAPCSATGTIRRHPDVALLKEEKDIAALAGHQARLLDAAADHVAPGGTLVYATCSLEREEGEDQIAAFLARDSRFARRPVTAQEVGAWAEIVTNEGDIRTLPSHFPHENPRLSGLDGFFASRLVRSS